eukprot:8195212-Pyramimonas_sp.AAC.1
MQTAHPALCAARGNSKTDIKVCPNASKPTHRSMIPRPKVMGFAHALPGGTSCTGHRAPKRDAFSFERLYVIQSQP